MSKDLTSEEDVQQSLDDAEGSRQGNNIKIPEGKTPIYMLKSDYADGYVHWVNLPEGATRVVCGCDDEHKGWDPEHCPLCKVTAQIYGQAKKLEDKEGKDDPTVKKIRSRANKIRAKYEAHFLAVVGELVKEKTGPGKFIWSSDFSDGRVGILSMTRQQYNDFTALRNSPDKYPFMKGPADLCNRPIVLEKSKKGNSEYATIEFIPSKHPSDPPEVEYEEDDFDLDVDFECDEDRLEKVAELISDSGDTDDAGIELEDDESPKKSSKSSKSKASSKKVVEEDDDLLGDDDEEEEEVEEEGEEEVEEEEEGEEEVEEEGEEEKPLKKKKSSKPSSKKHTSSSHKNKKGRR
jgi:hypothetical protein